ncbi:MAG TPA: hypothetical protein DCQ14_01685 [Firmicutes bacterium]|nr:hypothetical protein [Bacillota bacterium]
MLRLVPPGYFLEALSLYERHKFTLGIERVGLVNTERLLAEVSPPMPNSLAEEIVSDIDYASAYARWLLGNVIKCGTEQELPRHRRAITDSCMLYQNHTARQQELLALDLRELNLLKDQKTAREQAKKALDLTLRRLEREQGALRRDLEEMLGKIDTLQEKAAVLAEECQHYTGALEVKLREQCAHKWERESAKSSPGRRGNRPSRAFRSILSPGWENISRGARRRSRS